MLTPPFSSSPACYYAAGLSYLTGPASKEINRAFSNYSLSITYYKNFVKYFLVVFCKIKISSHYLSIHIIYNNIVLLFFQSWLNFAVLQQVGVKQVFVLIIKKYLFENQAFYHYIYYKRVYEAHNVSDRIMYYSSYVIRSKCTI